MDRVTAPLLRRRAAILEVAARVGLVFAAWHRGPRIYWVDVEHYWRLFRGLSLHHLPYRDFTWEFPPLTVLPMVGARLLSHSSYLFGLAFGFLMAALEYASLHVLRRRWPAQAGAISVSWYAGVLPLAAIAYFRLDFLSVALGTYALVRLSASRSAAGSTALGALAKLWPALLVLVPLWARRYRHFVLATTLTALAFAAWWAFSPAGFGDFLRFREGSGFHVETPVGAIALLAGATPSRASGAWVVAVPGARAVEIGLLSVWVAFGIWLTVVSRFRTLVVPCAVGAVVGALLLVSRLFSPQFLVWMLPFVALATADGERPATGAFALAALLTPVYLWRYEALLAGDAAVVAAVLLRNALLMLVTVRLAARALRPTPLSEFVVTGHR